MLETGLASKIVQMNAFIFVSLILIKIQPVYFPITAFLLTVTFFFSFLLRFSLKKLEKVIT